MNDETPVPIERDAGEGSGGSGAPPVRVRRSHRASLIEGVRLIILMLFAGGGYAVAQGLHYEGRSLALAIFLGALIGYVAGGIFGRTTASAVRATEQELDRTSGAELLAGTVGLILGLAVAALVTIPLFRLPPGAAYPAIAFTYLVLGALGARLAQRRSDELFGIFGLKPRAAGSRSGDVTVVDTSALIDGRILELARLGFLGGTLLLPEGVLRELQALGDSGDPSRRARGRRGLDVVRELQADPDVEVAIVRDEVGAPEDVDAVLVRLARERRASLITNDAQLAKVAEALEVRVRSVNRLADALRAPVAPGQALEIRLTREGRDAGQGVGFLDDGTMVVVDGGQSLVGRAVEVTVTNVLQTPNGRMLFARLPDAPAGRVSEAEGA